jgi:hypothetical protein
MYIADEVGIRWHKEPVNTNSHHIHIYGLVGHMEQVMSHTPVIYMTTEMCLKNGAQ